jgi:5-methylcytosine-specific restriction endonuclease McrA
MPHATPCLDCGQPAPSLKKGRCPNCQRERDRNDYYQSPEWRRIAREAKQRGGNECAICGATTRLIAHHVHARRDGGPDTKENTVLLCGAGAIGCEWQSCHNQYEADKRTGKDTPLRRLVEAL